MPATRGTEWRTRCATSSSGRCSRSTPWCLQGTPCRCPVSPRRWEEGQEEGREVFRKVVNVTSISGTQGNVGQINYAAAKAGLVGLTKTLAREWGPFKVNVNAVAFGFVDTRLTASSEEGATIERNGQEIKLGIPPQMREVAATIIPLGRAGTPEEAAGAIFFLCSPWSNFVQGQVLTVNGGQMTGMTRRDDRLSLQSKRSTCTCTPRSAVRARTACAPEWRAGGSGVLRRARHFRQRTTSRRTTASASSQRSSSPSTPRRSLGGRPCRTRRSPRSPPQTPTC